MISDDFRQIFWNALEKDHLKNGGGISIVIADIEDIWKREEIKKQTDILPKVLGDSRAL